MRVLSNSRMSAHSNHQALISSFVAFDSCRPHLSLRHIPQAISHTVLSSGVPEEEKPASL